LAKTEVNSKKTEPKAKSQWSDDELKEIFIILENIVISTKAFNSDKNNSAIQVAIAKIFDKYRDTLITGVANNHDADEIDILLFYNVCPKLEIHDLAALETVSGVRWQRYRLTKKGKALLVYMDKQKQ
jgi:hypothetical protein